MLGGVAEVVSSIPTVGHEIFSAFTGIVGLLYLSNLHINLHYKSVSVSDPM